MKTRIPDYLRLFILREGRVVTGRHYSNVWLLTAVLVAVFIAIAFANGSLNYLDYKMNDPFIKWVEIKKDISDDGKFQRLSEQLSRDEVRETYHFHSYSYDYDHSLFVFGKSDPDRVYLKAHFFDINNIDLIEAILGKDNLICGISPDDVSGIDNRSIGVFLTGKALARLGYKTAPAYVDIYQYSAGASRFGFKEIEGRVRVPVPVLGVVKRLPGNVDLVSFSNLYRQVYGPVLNMNNEEYASSLCYFVPRDVDEAEFDSRLHDLLEAETDIPFIIDTDGYDPRELYSWRNEVTGVDPDDGYVYHHLGFRQVYTDTLRLDPLVCSRVNEVLMNEYAGTDVKRIFKYRYSSEPLPVGDYLSIQFDDLAAIKPFAEELVNGCGLEVEMSQINAKENFQSVSVMGITLSVVMLAFAVFCILLYLVNLLRSYLQKIKRNIGTFKAFGISNTELSRVYLVIMVSMVSAALALSLALVSLIQVLLPVIGIAREDGFGYLALWRCSVIEAFPPLITVAAIVFVLAAAAVTVRLVMKNLLSATPGDLIYDR